MTFQESRLLSPKRKLRTCARGLEHGCGTNVTARKGTGMGEAEIEGNVWPQALRNGSDEAHDE